MRKWLPGTFTPPQAELTALADAKSTTALDALTFPDHETARANQAGRTAAVRAFGTMAVRDADGIRATGSTVAGRVLSLDLAAKRPRDFRQRVLANGLGADICT